MDAMTPSLPNRGMSAGFRCCACSTRHRKSFLSVLALKASSKMFKRLAVRAIANRMDAQLVAVLDGQLRGFPDFLDARRVVAGVARLVGIRLEQPRAPRAERAVDRFLDAANRQEALAVVNGPVLREVGSQRLVVHRAA